MNKKGLLCLMVCASVGFCSLMFSAGCSSKENDKTQSSVNNASNVSLPSAHESQQTTSSVSSLADEISKNMSPEENTSSNADKPAPQSQTGNSSDPQESSSSVIEIKPESSVPTGNSTSEDINRIVDSYVDDDAKKSFDIQSMDEINKTAKKSETAESLFLKNVSSVLEKDKGHFRIVMVSKSSLMGADNDLLASMIMEIQHEGSKYYYRSSVSSGSQVLDFAYLNDGTKSYEIDYEEKLAYNSNQTMTYESGLDELKQQLEKKVLESGTLTRSGKTYKYEKYDFDGSTGVALFDNDKLFRVEIYGTGDGKMVGLLYLEGELPMDENLYSIPSGFTFEDYTPPSTIEDYNVGVAGE